jgi:hypothetical protein
MTVFFLQKRRNSSKSEVKLLGIASLVTLADSTITAVNVTGSPLPVLQHVKSLGVHTAAHLPFD